MSRDRGANQAESRGEEDVERSHLRAVHPVPPPKGERRRWWRAPGMRGLLGLCLVALLIHLIPLMLPRNLPEQELEIARAMPSLEERVKALRPLKGHPKATPEDLREAAQLLLEGAPAEAHELVQEAERRNPTSVETLLLLARVCEVERRERCVRETFERAEQVAPKDARPDLLWADMRERVGDVEGAVEAVAKAHQKAPEDALVAVRYGRLLSEAGQYAEAEKVLRRLSSSVAAPKLLVELGLVRVKQGRDEEARSLFQRAVEQQPRFAVGHYYLGLAQHRLGHESEAEEELRTADRLDQADWRALAALCSVQLRTGQREAARATRMDLERRFAARMDVIRDTCRFE